MCCKYRPTVHEVLHCERRKRVCAKKCLCVSVCNQKKNVVIVILQNVVDILLYFVMFFENATGHIQRGLVNGIQKKKQHQVDNNELVEWRGVFAITCSAKSELYPRSSFCSSLQTNKKITDFKNSTISGIHVEKKTK